ncbi:MAG: hypothetical protein J7K57_02535 [Palaeococcus sp.]|uniref:hypothetical protein n=1 Tax=Palaeococcus sp. (in: euryarchaeotes) TaxID=2820298 RepID=UPI0025F94C4F|nr:hypothetical protein [Palaeococcus sp. (in: euryarchaeotes)]MCD6558743.1 hypothetical protein [Palaeococcus sp. (in: euryarchaeotes)]
MRLLKILLLSMLLMTSLSLLVQNRLLEGNTSKVVFTTECFVSPSAQALQVITNPKTSEVMIFDPEKGSALMEGKIPHSGPYCVVINSDGPVTAAIKVNGRYVSGEVLNIEYGVGGVSAFLLALLILWEGRKNDYD